MTNRLLFWLLVAAVHTVVVGLATTGLSLVGLLALMHVPAVLAAMLVVRAAWLLLQRRSPQLVVGNRVVLGGWPGFAVPMFVLLVWVGGRELGLFSARCYRTESGHSITTNSSAWREQGLEALPERSRIDVAAAAGALGERFREAVTRGRYGMVGHDVTGHVALDIAPPSALLPLYKSAEVRGKVTVELELRPTHDRAAPVRTATIAIDFEGSWTMLGFASQRDFHEYLGEDLGDKTRQRMFDWLKKADKE